MLRGSLFASVIAASTGLLLLPSAARADIEIFDLTLTPIFGSIGGTGVVEIKTPAPGTHGFDTVANGGLISMTFNLSNGNVFTLEDATGASVHFFSHHGQEVVNDFSYSGEIDNFKIDLQLNGPSHTYTFEHWANFKEGDRDDDGWGLRNFTIGTFTAVDPPPPDPVPGPIVGAGLPGLLIACLGLLALRRRRRSAATA
jgi:hypothetical protein